MPGRRTKQAGPPRINWGNPLARNPAFLAVLSSPRELVNGIQMTPSGTTVPVQQVTPSGTAKKFTSGAATVSYLDLGATSAPSTVDIADGPCTFVGVFYANSTTGVAIAERNDGNSVNLGWLFGYALGDTAKPGLAFVREYSSANLRKSITDTVSPGLNVMVVTHDGSNLSASVNIYLNGRLGTVFGNFDGSGTTGSDVGLNLYVGRNVFDTSHSHDGTILLAGAFRRQWSQAEVMSFMADPWQILTAPIHREAYSLPASGTNVTPGAGSVSITGFAPTVAQPQTAAPGVGSLTLTGRVPSVTQPIAVTAGAGSILLTGFAPAIVQNTNVAPGVGALSLTGFAPSIAQPQTALPGVASLTFTGYAPTIQQGQSANPGVGSITITGYAPAISQPQSAAPGVGTLAITGYAPGIAQPVAASPGAASIVFTGYAPGVAQTANQALTVGTGSLTLSGFAPTATQTANQSVAPGTGAAVLSGFAPTVSQASSSPSLVPDVGVLVLTGYAPTVTGGPGFPGFEVDQKRPRRRLPEVHRVPVLQRALEKRLRRVRPANDRAAARAKAIEFEAAALVLDGATAREIAPLLQAWEMQRPYIPPQLAELPTLDVFLSQIGFRIEQAQAAKATIEAEERTRRQDEDALLALMLA